MTNPQDKPTLNENLDATEHSPSSETTAAATPNTQIKQAEQQIASAQSVVYLIAVVTTLYFVYLGFSIPDKAQFIVAGLSGIVLGLLGFFSGRNQYVLMATLTLFFVDTAYSIVEFIRAYSEQQAFGNNPQISGFVYVFRFYLMKEMFEGIKAFRTLRRALRSADTSAD